MNNSLLVLENVHANIGKHHILQGVSMDIPRKGISVLIGRNGSGKSTTLRAIMGLVELTAGSIRFGSEYLDRLRPFEIARKGVVYVPEDHAVSFDLTVKDNFRLIRRTDNRQTGFTVENVFDLFPDLQLRWLSKAGFLSGGQKQMLAIGLAMVSQADLLLVDEPSKGLAPIVIKQLSESLLRISERTKIILVEQNFQMAAAVGEDYFILDDGRVVRKGQMLELVENSHLKKQYLGIG